MLVIYDNTFVDDTWVHICRRERNEKKERYITSVYTNLNTLHMVFLQKKNRPCFFFSLCHTAKGKKKKRILIRAYY